MNKPWKTSQALNNWNKKASDLYLFFFWVRQWAEFDESSSGRGWYGGHARQSGI
jgi:hypothetical protein